MRRAGGRYRAAKGARIPNLGQRLVGFSTLEGHKTGLKCHVADVERPLIAASQLDDSGHKLSLAGQRGVIEHVETGRKIHLRRVGGVYVLPMVVRAFPRPGR